jgi:hypothetical protein
VRRACATRAQGTGDKADPKSKIAFDVRIAKGKGATGSMELAGQSLTILQVGTDSYLSADSTFLTSMGLPAQRRRGSGSSRRRRRAGCSPSPTSPRASTH